MARFRLRPKAWIIGGTGRTTITGSLQTTSLKALGSVLLGGRGRTNLGGGVSYIAPPPTGDTWTVPDQMFIEGSGSTYDMKPTVPAGIVAGGLFDVDATGTQLPSGMTVSDVGVLAVGTTAASNTTNVKYGYTEPNAIPLLTLVPKKSGVFPYRATVFPVKGALPSGRFFVSPDDANLRSSTLSTWPDGSARVVVIASCGLQVDAGVNKQVRLRLNKSTDSAGTDLTVARIGALISNITFNFGSPVQLTNFATPQWVWWKNSQMICARYRVPLGMGIMEAQVDIHAFKNHATGGDYALVECVIENGSINSAAASITTPPSFTYSGTISVNGSQMASHTTPLPGLEIENYSIRRNVDHPQTQPTSGPYDVINQYAYNGTSSGSTGAAAIAAGASATVGVCIALSAGGDFSGHGGSIAHWSGSAWSFIGPTVGMVGAPIPWKGDIRKEDKVIWTGSRWELGMAGGHESGRAWWSSAWVHAGTVSAEYDYDNPGAADPGIQVVHSTAALQQHPLFWKQAVPISSNIVNRMTRYNVAYWYRAPFDKYVPYFMGRNRTNNMNDGGDEETVAPHWETQVDYVLSSNPLIQRVVITDGLAWTGFAEHWRDSTTHQPALPTAIGSKNWNGLGWPYHWSAPAWGGSQHEERAYINKMHIPSIAIVPFMCRPSPYFIEQAQHYLAWWWQIGRNGQVRSEMARERGWGTRTAAYASFMTPDNLYAADGTPISQAARKAEYAQALVNAATSMLRYRDVQSSPPNTLNFMYGFEVDDAGTIHDPDEYPSRPGLQFTDSAWMHHIAAICFHMVDKCELLTGSAAATFTAATDWALLEPVRRVMECEAAGNTAWRMQTHEEAVGTEHATTKKLVSTMSNWSDQIQQYMGGTVPTTGGPWLTWDVVSNWQDTGNGYQELTVANVGYNYQDWFLSALSCAVERDLPGASQAWNIVATKACQPTGGLTSYITGYNVYSKFNRWPRNK